MTGFSAEWLSLRADADRRARNRDVAAALQDHFDGTQNPTVLDFGSGAGANLRATGPLLPTGQHWILTDNDAALLEHVQAPAGTTLECHEIDLSRELDQLWSPAPTLVTASAFFDLCGQEWIDQLIADLTKHRSALYAVLSYDGREAWFPPNGADASILSAFHADQRRDKGLGPALGPNAHRYLKDGLHAAGYLVTEGRSDWLLSADTDSELIAALAAGTASAVAESIGPEASQTWQAARGHAERVMIGHMDLFASPKD